MLILLAVALSVACGSSLVPLRQDLELRDRKVPVRQWVYPSGLRVVAERDARSPVVGVFLVVGAGSSSDPPGKEGLAHYVERLTFRSRPFGKSNVARLLERAGASSTSASTGLDAAVYYELGPATALPELLRVEGARMLAPVVQLMPESLAAELGVLRAALRQRDPTGVEGDMLAALQARLFPAGHPYARPVNGTSATLGTISTDDVAAFIKTHYQPHNMTLVVVGDVDLATIDQTFARALPPELLAAPSATQTRPPPLPARAPEPPTPPGARSPIPTKEAPVAKPEVWVGWSLPRAFDSDAHLIHFVERFTASAVRGASATGDDIVGVSTQLVAGKDASMLLCRVMLQRGLDPARSVSHVVDRIYRAWGITPGGHLELSARRASAIVSMLAETEDLRTHGSAEALRAHFARDTVHAHALRSVKDLEGTRASDYAARYLTRERARVVVFTPLRAGVVSEVLPAGAHALDEDPLPPIHLDAARLRAAFPVPSVRQYRQITLANGLRVVLGARPGLPIVTARVLLYGGSSATSDIAGASVGFLLARASDDGHGAPSQFGAVFGQHSERDRSGYLVEGAAGNVGILLAVLAERVQSMGIESGAWDKFQRKRLPFLRAREREPGSAAERAFWAALIPGHVYGRTASAAEIGESSTDAAQRWIDATHVPRNAVLSVVGEIDVAQVERIVVEQFGGWPDRGPETPRPPPFTAPASAATAPQLAVTARPGVTWSQIRFGCMLPPSLTSAIDVRHDLAAEHLGERLRRSLRDKLGVAASVSASAGVLRGGSAYLEVQGAAERDRLGVALTTLRDAIRELAAAPIEPLHLDWAKLRLVRARSVGYLTNRNIAKDLVERVNLGWGPASVDAYPDEVAAVTAEQIREDFTRCANGRPVLAVIGDEAAARKAFAEAWP